ncbi:MAG: hypothetical protein NW224_21825 [Leptolyngbyaceae cyanobacterium bins.302]|nr:hypothetical protein [Leptolyngbyaceae cyanobacterium bins.302]
MSQRAIDRFRPQPASRPQSRNQGNSQDYLAVPIALDGAVNSSVEPNPNQSDDVATPSSFIHLIPVDLDSTDLDPTVPLESAVSEQSSEKPSETAPQVEPIAKPQRPFYRKALTHTKRQIFKGAKVLGMPLLWVGLAAFCGGTGYAAFNWLSTIPPVPDCDRIWFFSTDSDKLFCAEQAARSGNVESLQTGLKLVEPWLSGHQLQAKASRLHREWSKQLLQVASRAALGNDLDQAIKLAEAIKPENPLYREAKNSILEWQKLRDRDHLLASTVEAALKAQDWKKAETELQPRSSQISDYQRQQLNRLRERVVTERIAFNQLQQVRELVKHQSAVDVETLGRAIQLATQINPASYVSDAAKLDIQRWSQSLVKIAEVHLQKGTIPKAIAAAQWIPADAPLSQAVQDLMWVSRAQNFDQLPVDRPLNQVALWQPLTILAALQQIQPASPLYSLAQAHRSRLEYQVQDLTQLSLASTAASVPQIPSLQVAIQMAQAITPDRPNRIWAQTLIAQWRKEMERVQDRPYLSHAQKLAKPGKIKNLQAAIAQASKIPLGRALRPEAQAAVFDWRQQIQTIEDKPTLDRARQLAQQKQLATAIDTASQIPPERALYPEAQKLIQTWTTTMQAAEDRPILDEAKTLATQGNLGAAIGVAYQIMPERALYNEAQTAIAQWTAQLNTTRRSQRFDNERQGWDARRNSEPRVNE